MSCSGDGNEHAGADGGGVSLVAVTPAAGDSWLHEPVRFRFDAALDPRALAEAQIDVALNGVALPATLALAAPDTVALTIDPAATGTGTLTVTGTLAGAALHQTYTLAPWSRVDHAASEARLAIDRQGVVVAWLADAHVVVSRLDGSALGEPLGPASAVALTVAGDAPVVGWIDGGVAHVARWDGAWHELASPGRGARIALATLGAAPVAAVFGATAQVRMLVDDRWTPLGDDLAVGAVSDAAIAAGDRVAIAWLAGGQLRAARFDAAWTAIAPLAIAAPPVGQDHLSLAARGDTFALAYDAWAGSLGVVAATLRGEATAWTPLGHLLDVDPASDALGPAIAIGEDGAPVVAWTENSDGHARGIVARHAGGARWQIVAGASFGDALAPTQLALVGGAPVVSWTAGPTTSVARFNGRVDAQLARASRAGCTISASAPPALLSQTGCFALRAGLPTPHAGLVPYRVVNELWADGAHKRRWIGLPDGAPAMTVSATGAWTPPVGTILVKEFALEMTPGDAASRRPVETRFLVREAAGWQGFSYRWRTDGSDATLEPDEAETVTWRLADGSSLPHVYPSRSHCVSCHEGSYGPMLGLRGPQMQRWVDLDGVIADQIPLLAAAGIAPQLDDAPLPSPHDPALPIEARMRGYMAANCAHCHNPDHIAIKDLRIATPLADTRLCEAVTPGAPSTSVLYQKVSSRPGMPALGTAMVDPFAVQLVGAWIGQLRSCP